MALPPDSGDSFLREVDENLRRDQMRDFGKIYGGWLFAAVVLFLASVGGWLYWQDRQRADAAEDSEALAQVYTDIGANKMTTVPQRLETLADNGGNVVRASALFARAAVAIEQNDRKLAAATYQKIAADEDLAKPYRDLGLIRATFLEFDSIKPEDVIARMQPLAKAGEPWFGSAGELTAMAYLKQGKKTEAGRLFAAVAGDRKVPDSSRSRAAQIAGTLGVDASTAIPAMAQ